MHDLFWIDQFTSGNDIDNITIISICGAAVSGAPPGSTIARLENI